MLSLVAMGLTTGEVSVHVEEIYGPWLSEDTISEATADESRSKQSINTETHHVVRYGDV